MADVVTAILIVLALGAITLAVLLCYCAYKCIKWCCGRIATSLAQRPERGATSLPQTPERAATSSNGPYKVVSDDKMRHTTIEMFLLEMANERPLRFTANQLAGFTRHHSTQLGRGGFGTVYRGTLPNGLAVAVKVLHGGLRPTLSKEQFMAEMGTVGRTHHINLVRLYGFCFDGATHALVYEFMDHGSLGDYLSRAARGGGTGVNMATLAEIATGIARGLRYLHEECQHRILHLDIKPGNVLLDRSLRPKLADFGLARVVNHADTHVSVSRAGGTPVYAPPELVLDFDMRLSEKWDVYSFGVLLLSIVGRGKKNWESQQGFPRTVWTRYAAGQLMELVGRHGGEDEQRHSRILLERMCKVAFWCVQRQPPARPPMSEVVEMLQGKKQIPTPPNPFQYLDAQASATRQRGGCNN